MNNKLIKNEITKTIIMEFPDTTLHSPLSNHLSNRFTHFLQIEDLDEEKRIRGNLPADNLPRQLATSLRAKLFEENIQNLFHSHTGSDTPFLLDMPPDKSVNPIDAYNSLLECTNYVNILRNALLKSINERIHPLCNKWEDKPPSLATRILNPTEKLVKLYSQVAVWQRISDTTTGQGSNNVSWTETPNAWVNRHITVVRLNGQWIVLPHDAMLMIKDMVWGKFLVCLYCFLDPTREYIQDNLDFLWQWGGEGLKRYGDSAYDLIKMIEPVCTAKLIQMSEGILDRDEQLKAMVSKYNQKEIEVSSESGLVVKEKDLMANKLFYYLEEVVNPHVVSEFFSLLKMMGHPYIYPILGSQAIEKLAKAESTATYQGIKAVGWSFCHMFTKGFIDQRKRWPPLLFNLPPGYQSTLKELCDQNHSPLPLGLSIYNPSDWDYVTFLPVDEFDYGTDILSLITDKSLSYKRTEIDNSWSGRLSYTPQKATSSNRVLEQLLKEDLDMKKVCDMVATNTIPFDWKVVTVHPKEREMKAFVARMFAIMVLAMRVFFCLLEMNLALKLFPFFPEQTMTMNQSEKEEVFLDVTSQSAEKCTLSIGIDLSKWCSHFRERTVSPVSDRLNQLLGVTRLYGYVHQFFRESLIVLRHPAFTPTQDTRGKKGDLKEEPGIYTGAEAGLEGTQQKMWTLVTLCMLHWAVWKFGFSYKITCQGDNLVIHISLHRRSAESIHEFHERVKKLNTSVLKDISVAASMIGHDVNPDECFSSTSFTTYGKDMWFKGIKLETLTKVITRMFPKTTTDVPSTESIIANIAATGTSLVERSNDPIPAFFLTKFMEYLVIKRELKGSIVHKNRLADLSESRLWNLTQSGFPLLCGLIPSNLGGFPVSSFAEYLYRGHSDPLSSSLGSLQMFSSIPIISKFMKCLERTDVVGIDETEDQKEYYSRRFKLVHDPYSIPIRSVRGATEKTSEHVNDALLKITKNRMLTPIINLTTDHEAENTLISQLLHAVPVSPKVLHEIHKSSVYGVGKAVAKRFTNTRTLRRITTQLDVDLISAHINNDLHYVKSTLRFLSQFLALAPPISPVRPVFQLLIELRKRWGLGIIDGVTNYHPLVAGSWIPSSLINPSLLSDVVDDISNPLLVASSLTSSVNQCSNSRGPEQPYLGNMTSEKAISKWTKPIDASPPLRDALRLIQISKLCTNYGSNFRTLIEQLAVNRTSLPLPILYEMSREQVGGTMAHRLNLSSSQRGSRIASLPNWSTHFTVSSNLSREMGSVDYPISYHEYYLTLLCFSRIFFHHTDRPSPFCLIQHINLTVLEPVQDAKIEIPTIVIPKKVVVPQGSYYLFATSVTLAARSKVGLPLPFDNLGDTKATPVEALAHTLLTFLTGNIKMIKKSGYTRSVTNSRLLLDLPEAAIFTKSEYIRAGAISILLFSSNRIISRLNRDTEMNMTILQVLLETSLILSPLMFRTISLSSLNDDGLLREMAGSVVPERHIIHLGCLLTHEAQLILEEKKVRIPPVFEHMKGLMSSSLATRVYLKILHVVVEDGRFIPSCKFLSRLVTTVLGRPSEEVRVGGLTNILERVGWQRIVCKDDLAAETRVRGIRSRETKKYDEWTPITHTLPRIPQRQATSTDCLLELDTPPTTMPAELLIESWLRRPYPGKSDSYMKWAPICTHLQSGEIIYILGIGAGGILQCIPGECKVFGLDLPLVVQNLGQSFVNYEASYPHPDYRTRSLTWLTDVSSLCEENILLILEDIKKSNASTVIIDVDRVDPMTRVRLRERIARLGVNCWVRVYTSQESIRSLIQSIDSIRNDSDDWWQPIISCGCEVIFGCGSRPLGINEANGDVDNRILEMKCRAPRWDEILEFVFRFGGNVRDMEDIEGFIWRGRSRRGEGYASPLAIYLRCMEEPDEALELFGRLLCRISVVIVSRYL
jgi:hypothetical protein